jgi:hypothetical protein
MYYYYYYNSPVKIKLIFKEENGYQIGSNSNLPLMDFSSILYDINLLGDCITLASIEKYSNFKFSSNFFYRKGRPIENDHKLYLNSLNRNSPLSIELLIPLAATALGIPWLLLQAFEKIRNWNLNHEKLKLDIEQLKLDNQQKKIDNIERLVQLDEILHARGANKTFESINKRFDNSNLTATDIEINFLNNDDD